MANVEEIKRLELLSEDIKNEIDELQSLLEVSDQFLLKAKRNNFQTTLGNIISNLESANDSVYSVYETLNAEDNGEELAETNEILERELAERLTDDEKVYFRIKFGIDLF